MFLQPGETIDFDIFLPHSVIDAFFVLGNILIFCFAIIGFYRFWKALKGASKGNNISFARGLSLTLKEIITHEKFLKCGKNRPRAIAHYLVLAGFVSAMIATGLVLLFAFLPHYINVDPVWWPPLELPNPVKIFGAVGGIGLLVGSSMLIYRRWANRDEVGANGYADYLFLYVIFLTGLSGMLSWIARAYIGAPMLAYVIYFIHIVLVFFLLWYMPYSKFAHMIYRTLALVYLNAGGKRA